MPEIYSKYHDKFLQNYLACQETAGMIGNNVVVPGKSKTNFIFPIKIRVNVIEFKFFYYLCNFIQ